MGIRIDREVCVSGSHVLRNVVASLLAAGALLGGDALATSFCSVSGCQVRPPSFVPGYGGAGGGGGWGNDGNSGDPEREYQARWCMDFPHEVWKYGCDIYSPPPLAVNGCGTAGGMPVPDFLVSPVMPAVAVAMGTIFREACDVHDTCYGTPGANKAECDHALYRDMVELGERNTPAGLRAVFAPYLRGQAWAYSRFLQWESVSPWTSAPAFNAAQDQAFCRRWSAEYRQICQ
ncbi:MAG TPA: hypothetical protein VD865_00930 [Stenotrophomonas sp.]|nr:hypothetical protein [Stenotrophomonas sp.]